MWVHLTPLAAWQEEFDREKERLVRERERRDRAASPAGRPGTGPAGSGLVISPPPLVDRDSDVDEFVNADSDDLYSTRDGLAPTWALCLLGQLACPSRNCGPLPPR